MLLETLLGKLKSKNSKSRAEAARALGELQDPRAVEPLIAALADGGEARQDIIWALGRHEDYRAVDPLIPFLQDQDWHLRAQGAESLGQIASRKVDPGPGTDTDTLKVVDALLQALSDPHDGVHWKVAFALGEIGNPKAVESLLAFVSPERCPRCWHAAWALGRIGDRRATEPILSLLPHPDSVVRRHAAMALKMLKDSTAAPGLSALLEDPDWEIRQYASEALIAIGPGALEHLERKRGQSDDAVRKKLDWIIDTIREIMDEK